MAKRYITFHLDSIKFKSRLFGWSMLLPTNFYIAKFFVLGANLLFSYNVFRVNALFRANRGSTTLQSLLNERKVTFIESQELKTLIDTACLTVQDELKMEGIDWKWDGGDLHDDVVLKLAKELKLAELIRTHRRTRMHAMVHTNATIDKK